MKSPKQIIKAEISKLAKRIGRALSEEVMNDCIAKVEERHHLLFDNARKSDVLLEILFQSRFFQDSWLVNAKDLHCGKRCFLLCCGPSLNRVDLCKLKNEVVMGVNGAYMLDSVKLDYFVSVSHVFWKSHFNELREYKCERRFLPSYLNMLESTCDTSWMNMVTYQHHKQFSLPYPWSFSTDVSRYVFNGGTVTFVCLQLLYYLGFSRSHYSWVRS